MGVTGTHRLNVGLGTRAEQGLRIGEVSLHELCILLIDVGDLHIQLDRTQIKKVIAKIRTILSKKPEGLSEARSSTNFLRARLSIILSKMVA